MSTLQREKEDYEGRMKVQSDKISKLLDRLANMENEAVKAKRNMGEIMNIIVENCRSDVVEKIHEAMSDL